MCKFMPNLFMYVSIILKEEASLFLCNNFTYATWIVFGNILKDSLQAWRGFTVKNN